MRALSVVSDLRHSGISPLSEGMGCQAQQFHVAKSLGVALASAQVEQNKAGKSGS